MIEIDDVTYPRFPNRVILDLKDAVGLFHYALDRMEGLEHTTDEVIHSIMTQVHHKPSSAEAIDSVVAEYELIYAGHPDVMGPAVRELAEAFHAQLALSGIRTPSGIVPYQLAREWEDVDSPLLVKDITQYS